MEIDANQVHQSPITLTDGPVESVLTEELGLLPVPTRLYGRIWTGGAAVVIRYYEARPPDGDPIPICGVVGEPTLTIEPADGALHNPALGLYHEASRQL